MLTSPALPNGARAAEQSVLAVNGGVPVPLPSVLGPTSLLFITPSYLLLSYIRVKPTAFATEYLEMQV